MRIRKQRRSFQQCNTSVQSALLLPGKFLRKKSLFLLYCIGILRLGQVLLPNHKDAGYSKIIEYFQLTYILSHNPVQLFILTSADQTRNMQVTEQNSSYLNQTKAKYAVRRMMKAWTPLRPQSRQIKSWHTSPLPPPRELTSYVFLKKNNVYVKQIPTKKCIFDGLFLDCNLEMAGSFERNTLINPMKQ